MVDSARHQLVLPPDALTTTDLTSFFTVVFNVQFESFFAHTRVRTPNMPVGPAFVGP